LSQDSVIQQVRDNFVPVAVNLYKIRQAQGAGGDLFRSVQRQQPQYQGIWVVSPDGKVLASHHEIKDQARWPQEILDTIAAGLRAFGPLAPRTTQPTNPLPNRGVGVQVDGSVCLALYSRHVRGGGKDAAPSSVHPTSLWLWDGDLRPDGPPVIDSVTLTGKEWAAFSPSSGKQGATWEIPEALARKLARVLSPSSDQSTMPKPEEAKVAQLSAKVESVTGDQTHIRFSGRYETLHVYNDKPSFAWALAQGSALYDGKQKRMRWLRITLSGAYRMVPPWDKQDRPIAAMVEWRSE
jgi:hypothetical protein